MKTSDRVNFMNSLEVAQARTINAQLANRFVEALVHEGYCFSRPAPAWCIGTLPHHDTSVQVEFDNNDVHLILLEPRRKHNSFDLKPNMSFTVNTEEDMQRAVYEFNTLFHYRTRMIDVNGNPDFDYIHYYPRGTQS